MLLLQFDGKTFATSHGKKDLHNLVFFRQIDGKLEFEVFSSMQFDEYFMNFKVLLLQFHEKKNVQSFLSHAACMLCGLCINIMRWHVFLTNVLLSILFEHIWQSITMICQTLVDSNCFWECATSSYAYIAFIQAIHYFIAR